MTIIQLPGRDGRTMGYRNGRRLVCVAGQHDASTVGALSDQLAWAIASDHNDVTVDLHEVAFMDASTVGVFLRARTFLRTRGRTLRLECPSPIARRVLDLCHVEYDVTPASPGGPNLHVVDSA